MLKKTIILALLVVIGVCLAGCNTIAGVGGDIKWSGEQMQNAAGNFTK